MTRSSRLTALALASVSSIALTAAAQAQPVHNWTGFYVGLNAGAAWGHSDASTRPPCTEAGTPPGFICTAIGPGEAPLVAGAGSGSISETSFTGGIQAGFNWQSGNVVLGAELDFGAFDVSGSRTGAGTFAGIVLFGPVPFTVTNSVDTDWLFTARARVGWAVSNVLVYATGGLAVTQIEVPNTYSQPGITAFGTWSGSDTKLGWTIGAGLEWAFARNWSVKAEYLYVDFGSVAASGRVAVGTGTTYSNAISTSTDVTAHMARAGENFRF